MDRSHSAIGNDSVGTPLHTGLKSHHEDFLPGSRFAHTVITEQGIALKLCQWKQILPHGSCLMLDLVLTFASFQQGHLTSLFGD